MLELRLHRKEAQLQDLEQEQWHQWLGVNFVTKSIPPGEAKEALSLFSVYLMYLLVNDLLDVMARGDGKIT